MKENRFEKHPKTYGLIFFCIISLLILAALEFALSSTNKVEIVTHIERHIRLKELSPSAELIVKPDSNYMKGTDSLVQKEYPLKIDRFGYIKPSLVHDTADVTILFLGGSTTECLYVEQENRFPYLVGRILENTIKGKRINSLNSGISGNHTLHSINILLNKGLLQKPDFVVMMHNINDLSILINEGSYWNNNPTRSLLIETNQSKSSTVQAGKDLIYSLIPNTYNLLLNIKNSFYGRQDEFEDVRNKDIVVDNSLVLKKFEKNLKAFIEIAKAYNSTPVLMTQANRFIKEPDDLIVKDWPNKNIIYDDYRDLYNQMNQVVRNVAREKDIVVIDLATIVPQSNEYLYDVVHYNDFGSKFVANYIAEMLEPLLK